MGSASMRAVTNTRGRRNSPYEPRMMVKVLVYGYATGVFSSRKLATKLVEDIASRFGTARPSRAVGRPAALPPSPRVPLAPSGSTLFTGSGHGFLLRTPEVVALSGPDRPPCRQGHRGYEDHTD